jgi:hypothetical protein
MREKKCFCAVTATYRLPYACKNLKKKASSCRNKKNSNFFLFAIFFYISDFILVVFLRGFHLGCLLSLSAEVFFTWFSLRAILKWLAISIVLLAWRVQGLF